MYKYLILAGLVALGACRKTSIEKPVADPVMDYTELNQEMSFGQVLYVDIDNNSSKDFLFYTLPVSDPLTGKSYRQYHIASSYGASVIVDTIDEHTPAFVKNEVIPAGLPAPFDWFNASGALLARKVVGAAGTPSWEGSWANASHQYVAVRVLRAGLSYYGWLELSFDSKAEKVILHRAAICREAEKEVKAGK